jgi:hypothetical protein
MVAGPFLPHGVPISTKTVSHFHDILEIIDIDCEKPAGHICTSVLCGLLAEFPNVSSRRTYKYNCHCAVTVKNTLSLHRPIVASCVTYLMYNLLFVFPKYLIETWLKWGRC